MQFGNANTQQRNIALSMLELLRDSTAVSHEVVAQPFRNAEPLIPAMGITIDGRGIAVTIPAGTIVAVHHSLPESSSSPVEGRLGWKPRPHIPIDLLQRGRNSLAAVPERDVELLLWRRQSRAAAIPHVQVPSDSSANQYCSRKPPPTFSLLPSPGNIPLAQLCVYLGHSWLARMRRFWCTLKSDFATSRNSTLRLCRHSRQTMLLYACPGRLVQS
jgi:hypothetical protein